VALSKQRAAIIGLGFVGRAHLQALRRIGVPVQGVLSSSPEFSKEADKFLSSERTYASLDELAADASVTVVHICTPNYVHFEQSSRLMRAGKHVLCEKPLAMDSRETEMLVSIAKETGRVDGLAYNLRYYPLCHQAKAMIASGAIGQPRLVHGSFLQDWLLRPTDWNWRLDSKLGGDLRAISDIGTHWLDLMMWMTGCKVTSLCADLATVIPVRHRPRGKVESFQKAAAVATDEVAISTEDYGSVLLHFENEMHGVMTVSQVSAGRKASLWFEVNGSEGSLAWNSESPNTLWIGRRDAPNELLPKDTWMLSPSARHRGLPRRSRRRLSGYLRSAFPRVLSISRRRKFPGTPSLPHLSDRPRRTAPLRSHPQKRPNPLLDRPRLGLIFLGGIDFSLCQRTHEDRAFVLAQPYILVGFARKLCHPDRSGPAFSRVRFVHAGPRSGGTSPGLPHRYLRSTQPSWVSTKHTLSWLCRVPRPFGPGFGTGMFNFPDLSPAE